MTEKTRKSRWSFQRRSTILYPILLVLIGVAVGPLLFHSVRLINLNQEYLRRGQQELQLSRAKSLSQDIDGYVRSRQMQVLLIAESLAAMRDTIGEANFRFLLTRETILDRYRKGDLLALHLGSPETGQTSVSTGAEDIISVSGLRRDLEDGFPRSLRDGVFFGQPRLLPSYEPAMVLSLPLPVEGEVHWVLSAVITLEPVSTLLAERTSEDADYTYYILDRDLRLFAHSIKARVVEGRDMTGVPLVQLFDRNREAPSSSTEKFVRREDGREVRMLGTYVPLPQFGWALFIETEEAAAYDVVRAMVRQTVLWLVIAFAVATIFAFFFARMISAPIQALAERCMQIAQGNYGERIPVRSTNELGQLAGTVNHMSEEIEDLVGKLRRAAERENKLMLGSIRTLAAAIDAKDPYTQGHSLRVSNYASKIAHRMGLHRDELRTLEVGAILHDIGKIGIEDRILKKPGALSQDEYEMMKQHVRKGATIMEPHELLRPFVPILRYHHERYDGKGYPERLKGEEIPLLARIVTAADTFDAMTTDRPYQKAMTFRDALAKMIEFKGKALDPKIVDKLIECYHHGELVDPREAAAAEAPPPAAAGGRGA